MCAGLTLTVDEVARLYSYLRGDGRPDRDKVYGYVRRGTIPPPIHGDIPVCDWRWSAAAIRRDVNGELEAVAS
jgi:hypothetical protein